MRRATLAALVASEIWHFRQSFGLASSGAAPLIHVDAQDRHLWTCFVCARRRRCTYAFAHRAQQYRAGFPLEANSFVAPPQLRQPVYSCSAIEPQQGLDGQKPSRMPVREGFVICDARRLGLAPFALSGTACTTIEGSLTRCFENRRRCDRLQSRSLRGTVPCSCGTAAPAIKQPDAPPSASASHIRASQRSRAARPLRAGRRAGARCSSVAVPIPAPCSPASRRAAAVRSASQVGGTSRRIGSQRARRLTSIDARLRLREAGPTSMRRVWSTTTCASAHRPGTCSGRCRHSGRRHTSARRGSGSSSRIIAARKKRSPSRTRLATARPRAGR